MINRIVPGFLSALLAVACGQAAAAQGAASEGSFGVARLENGAFVGFALVRSGQTSGKTAISDVVLPRSKSVSRVLYDQAGAAYFGYRLEVETLGGRGYRMKFRALGDDVESELQRRFNCSNCPRPMLLPRSQPRFPAPFAVKDGDLCTLDLLVNPQTGEKIVDVIKVSGQDISPETMRAATDKIREALRLALLADTLVARRDYTRAITEYQKALAINPNDPVVNNKLGLCLQWSGRLDEAQKQYEQAVKLNPGYAEAWNNLGTCFHARLRYGQAIKNYQKAVEMRPSFATAYRNMGSAYFSQNRLEEGYVALQAAFRLDPAILSGTAIGFQTQDAAAATQHFFFAKINAANGQVEEAVRFLGMAFDRGFRDCSMITRDADFQKIQKDERFQRLLSRFCR
ncbi:MAG: tetratricopeptide repeat protein [Acidobacteria bacterium]|nr:MAG: tetratricopeptide repeat protein [Acidobacteriota bacterium]